MIIRYEPGSLRVLDGAFEDPAQLKWRVALAASRAAIERAIAGVGRLELHGNDRLQRLGSAWMVRAAVAATNRHTVEDLRREIDRGEVMINFLAERDGEESQRRRVTGVITLAADVDLALIRVADADERPAIALTTAKLAIGQPVCAIGYPARRLAHYDQARALGCFRGPFDVKRVSPGMITGLHPTRIDHDCATLGGSSGGVLLDVASGAAVGLHYGGQWQVANHAVPAALLAARLADL